MDAFALRDRVVGEYDDYVRSFVTIKDGRVAKHVDEALKSGFLWPDPLVQLNPAFAQGASLEDLVADGTLHPACREVFCRKPDPQTNLGPIRFYRHQEEAFRAARAGDSYVLTTGTGSGKSLSYIVPIVDHVLRRGSGKGVQAIVIYPMNALANSQEGELEKFLCHGFPQGRPPVTFARYTGQEKEERRQKIIEAPPDIILTNFMMAELLLTRPRESALIRAAQGLRFLVLDELHTYRGRQGADVALLVRRIRQACTARDLVTVGTSATLAGAGSWAEQQKEVSALATRLFGSEVRPDRIIGESLTRFTSGGDDGRADALVTVVEARATGAETESSDITADPLAAWLEPRLGVRPEEATGRLVRCTPRRIVGEHGVARELHQATGVAEAACEIAIRKTLMRGHASGARGGFVFRVHQFLSKGEAVYASLEPEAEREITLRYQQFVPGSERTKVLLPLAFCRECGQEYYVVRRVKEDGRIAFRPRRVTEHGEETEEAGFLHLSTTNAWPSATPAILGRVPDSWLDTSTGQPAIRKHLRDRLPQPKSVSADGYEGGGNLRVHFVPTPFRFCLECGMTYDGRQTSDYGKLATLGSEGRSTATSILSLSTIRQMRADESLPDHARKLLSFTDNRQDASLQAGHFNDFVGIALLRSALYRAVRDAGAAGLRHDVLPHRVFDALALPLALYASNPSVEYQQKDDTERALREVLGYYIYQDLRRGWRITSPNLEQCGLLEIDYASLKELCADQPRWAKHHTALAGATPEERHRACKVVLDFLRRELAIRVSYLEPSAQDTIRALSRAHLIGAWSVDDEERLERSRIVLPRSRGKKEKKEDRGTLTFLSPRGGLALFLKRPTTFPRFTDKLEQDDVSQLILQILGTLEKPGGLVHVVLEPRQQGDVPGYQLNAASMIWRAGDGSRAFHDPVRVPNAPEGGLRTNPFFVAFYRGDTTDLKQLEAREHTAQVPTEKREEREDAFREGRLPVLFCSPTMELDVDIAELNVVGLRNVPPTPANYAQRSGRAGRSGQPAFVSTYCAGGSSHDQYFFARPERMVAGAVRPPRLDLLNEEALAAHVRAIWLSCSGLHLGRSLRDILDVGAADGEMPSLGLLDSVKERLNDHRAREAALVASVAALGELVQELVGEGKAEDWLADVLARVPDELDRACERWRSLFRGAVTQYRRQERIVMDASRDARDREVAKRLRDEAMSQRDLLLEADEGSLSDFYSYRYFASEGFLPGYNFPRLPISAYLPGRRSKDAFLSRPRFVAVSEFGPRSIVYHEGHRYVINKALLPVDADEASVTRKAAICSACGYLHPLDGDTKPERCDRCDAPQPRLYKDLFRMQNVSTRRRDRINSDEEERLRMGFDLRTGVRFAERGGEVSAAKALLKAGGGAPLAELVYGRAATIWRMNLGWRRRAPDAQLGYLLDIDRGYWERRPEESGDPDPDDPASHRTVRVIPYVEDHRSCLLVRPEGQGAEVRPEVMATLQAALKVGVQVHFQLEDQELAAEPLPSPDDRRFVLLYEAAEGGAGALRRLLEERGALQAVARQALELAHFDPDTLEDRKHGPHAKEDCDAACYDCLLSYYNQREHDLLDRKLLPSILGPWSQGQLEASPSHRSRDEHLARLLALCSSELERRWLRRAHELGLRLPSAAQELVESASCRPDFSYPQAFIFVDGPPHDDPRQQKEDGAITERLDNYRMVIRFHHAADWDALFRRYPGVFGALPG